MKTLTLFLASLATLTCLAHRSSAAGPGENFFGYWVWHAAVPDGQAYMNPTDACEEMVSYLHDEEGLDVVFTGIRKADDFDTRNNYDCKMRHTSDGTNDVSMGIGTDYICPSNAHVITLMRDGSLSDLASDYRCKCDSGTCFASVPPTPDTSYRCKNGEPPPFTALPPATIVPPSVLNPTIRMAFIRAEYNAVAAGLQTEDCNFKSSDFYPDANKSHVNIGYLCGFRNGDFAAANKAAGFTNGTPANYTWHHDLNTMGEMQLVKTSVHEACSHTGGVAVWKKLWGIPDYPTSLPRLQ